jgi:hypothetical protein
MALILALSGETVMAQVEIKGTAYDRSQFNELQGVSVLSTSGAGTFSDSLGHYSIRLSLSDSIYFSYLGKKTKKFPVKGIDNPLQFDISLDVEIKTLTQIFVEGNSYHLDSLQNREEYEKIFNFEKASPLDGMKSSHGRGFGIGLDFDALLRPKPNKSMESVQRYFEEDERQNYVSHRFSKVFVKRITGLQSPALEAFMKDYRPSYDFTKSCTDWELGQYILDMSKSFAEVWKEEHPDSTGRLDPGMYPAPGKHPDSTGIEDSADFPIPGVR